MTSSSAPPTAPASEPFRFTDAARLHARRFNKHPVASALRLLSADQRITHPNGGIALLTEAGHSVRVVPTRSALRFVGAPTWAALSGEPVTTEVPTP